MPIVLLLVLLLLVPTAAAAEGELLDEIVATQQAVERVQGRYRQSSTSADDPAAEPNVYEVTFFLELPDKYHLCYSPADDPEAKEWWLGDGEVATHAEQLVPEIEPIVAHDEVEEGDWGFQRVADFFRLDREALEKDFIMTARRVDQVEGVPGAAAVVELAPRGGKMAEELQGITVILDGDYRTRRIVILDQQDNTIVVDVLEADYEAEIDPAVFRWEE